MTAMYTHLGANTQDCDVHTPRCQHTKLRRTHTKVSAHKTVIYTH